MEHQDKQIWVRYENQDLLKIHLSSVIKIVKTKNIDTCGDDPSFKIHKEQRIEISSFPRHNHLGRNNISY